MGFKGPKGGQNIKNQKKYRIQVGFSGRTKRSIHFNSKNEQKTSDSQINSTFLIIILNILIETD